MFLGLALPKELVGEPALAKKLYAEALADLEPKDAIAVIRDFRLGKCGDGHWAPKPATLRQAIDERLAQRAAAERREREAAQRAKERRDYRARLAAREASGETARIGKGFSDLAAELRARHG